MLYPATFPGGSHAAGPRVNNTDVGREIVCGHLCYSIVYFFLGGKGGGVEGSCREE